MSPHLDDAAFSAASRIMAGDCMVVTVFAGIPPAGQSPGAWDSLTRATCPRGRMLERIAEDEAAMRELRCQAERLDILDEQHRQGPVDKDRLCERLRRLFTWAGELWLPAGLGGHRDHLAVRDCSLAALRSTAAENHRVSVFLYADVPYAIRYGWPRWIDPENERDFVDVDYWLEAEMDRRGLRSMELTPSVHELSAAERSGKLAAVSAYRTQLGALRLDQLIAGQADSLLRYELSWKVGTASTATS